MSQYAFLGSSTTLNLRHLSNAVRGVFFLKLLVLLMSSNSVQLYCESDIRYCLCTVRGFYKVGSQLLIKVLRRRKDGIGMGSPIR